MSPRSTSSTADTEAAQKDIHEQRAQLNSLRAQHAAGRLTNVREIRKMRKNLARLHTTLKNPTV